MTDWDLELKPALRGRESAPTATSPSQRGTTLDDILASLDSLTRSVEALSVRLAAVEQSLTAQSGQEIADRAVQQLRAAREARRAARASQDEALAKERATRLAGDEPPTSSPLQPPASAAE